MTRRDGRTGESWSRRLRSMPPWFSMAIIASLLVGSWALVAAAGGTRTALPHIFYLPIILAALPFGIHGGVVAAVAATVLCGPLMPLDVATGQPQEMVNWLTRGVFFVGVGALSGATTISLRASFSTALSEHLDETEATSASTTPSTTDPVWRSRLDLVLERRAFRVVFQPIYRLHDGRLISVEALTRFDITGGDGRDAPPDHWFAAAQRVGLGTELELVTLEAALEASRDLDETVAMSFNASPALLLDLRLTELLDAHPARRLIVEITEHDIIDDYPRVDAALRTLRRRGLQVAIDDAGAGFASLRHIVKLEPDLIKLDPSLTQDIRNDPVRRPLAEALLRFAERTDTRVVVEGIETVSDLADWYELGADAAQGFVLARPGSLPFPLGHGVLGQQNGEARRRAASDRRAAADRRSGVKGSPPRG
jgi:EAL domain-containing protein (putative c-di-GMP-specific phosphodiesterase class I)